MSGVTKRNPPKRDRAAYMRARRAQEKGSKGTRPSPRGMLEEMCATLWEMAIAVRPGTKSKPNPKADEKKFLAFCKQASELATKLASLPEPAVIEATTTVETRVKYAESDKALELMSDTELVESYRRAIALGPSRDEIENRAIAWGLAPFASSTPSDPSRTAISAPTQSPKAEPSNSASTPNIGEPDPVEELVEATEPDPAPETPKPAPRPPTPRPPPEKKVVPFTPPSSPHSSDAPRPSVAEHANAIASSIGPDGRPRAINPYSRAMAASLSGRRPDPTLTPSRFPYRGKEF